MKVPWCFGFLGSCGSRLSSTADRATHQSTHRALGGHRRHARNGRTIAHLDIVTPLLGAVGCIAQAGVHGDGADRSQRRMITLHRGSASSTDRKALACKQFRSVGTRRGCVTAGTRARCPVCKRRRRAYDALHDQRRSCGNVVVRAAGRRLRHRRRHRRLHRSDLVNPRLNANPRVDEAHHRVSAQGFKYYVTEQVCRAAGGPQTTRGARCSTRTASCSSPARSGMRSWTTSTRPSRSSACPSASAASSTRSSRSRRTTSRPRRRPPRPSNRAGSAPNGSRAEHNSPHEDPHGAYGGVGNGGHHAIRAGTTA